MKYKKIFLLLAFMPLFLMAQTKDYNYYYSNGNELLQKKKGKDAISMFDSALLFKPKSSDAYIGRGTAKIYYYMPDAGLLDYDTAILYADKKDKLGFYRKKENVLKDKLNGYYSYSHELIIYNEAIAAFPDSPMAYLDRAGFYYLIGKINEALADAQESMKICHTVAGYENLAFYMKASHEYSEKKVVDIYDKCTKEFPNDAKSYFNRGNYFDRETTELFRKLSVKKETKEIIACREKAIADYKKAIDINPNYAVYYKYLTNAKMGSKKFSVEESMNDFKTWKEHCPNDIYIYTFRGFYFASIQRWKEAIADMDSMITYKKGSPDLYIQRADYKDRSGDYKPEDILKDLDKAAALKAETGYGYDDEIYKRLRAKYGK